MKEGTMKKRKGFGDAGNGDKGEGEGEGEGEEVVVVVECEDGLTPPDQFLRVPMGATVRVRVARWGVGGASHAIGLRTNMPTDWQAFDRSVFRDVPESKLSDAEADWAVFDIACVLSGSFEFVLEAATGNNKDKDKEEDKEDKDGEEDEGEDGGEKGARQAEGGGVRHFSVDPAPVVGGRAVPLDALCVQTFLTKCLGELKQWGKPFELAARAGFNCVHLTPVSKLGESHSAYSLADQTEIAASISPGRSPTKRHERMAEFVAWSKQQLGLLTLCDVVWNHTASNTDWLSDHPECGYHPGNSPHLTKAVLLDLGLRWLSTAVETGHHHLPSTINTVADVQIIFAFFRSAVLPQLRLWEFYAVDVDAAVDALRTWLSEEGCAGRGYARRKRIIAREERLAYLEKHVVQMAGPHGVPVVDQAEVAALYGPVDTRRRMSLGQGGAANYHPSHSPTSQEIQAACDELLNDLNVLNVERYRAYDADIEAAIANAAAGVIYQRVDQSGPRLNEGKVTARFPLVDPYFTLVRVPPNVALPRDSEVSSRSLWGKRRGWAPSGKGAKGSSSHPGSALGWDLWEKAADVREQLLHSHHPSLMRTESWRQRMRRRSTMCSEDSEALRLLASEASEVDVSSTRSLSSSEPSDEDEEGNQGEGNQGEGGQQGRSANGGGGGGGGGGDDKKENGIKSWFSPRVSRMAAYRLGDAGGSSGGDGDGGGGGGDGDGDGGGGDGDGEDGGGGGGGGAAKPRTRVYPKLTRMADYRLDGGSGGGSDEQKEDEDDSSSGEDDQTDRLVALANNGWIMGAVDPQHNFAGPTSNVYFRRELVVWGDCVKLRYGDGPHGECAWLWHHMREYTRMTVRLFDGIRVDNCHNTPMHVGQWLLDDARRLNRNLIVLAELFTSDPRADLSFVRAFGISTMVREAIRPGTPADLASLAHAQGGHAVGLLDTVPMANHRPHVILMDMTHDNETPSVVRTPQDALSTMALVAMAACAVGSTRGYDELLVDNPDVVVESRRYCDLDDITLFAARRLLMLLHRRMVDEGCSERHFHCDHPLVSASRVTRQGKGYLAVCRTAFHGSHPGEHLPAVFVPTRAVVPLFWARLVPDPDVAKRRASDVLAGPAAPFRLDLTEGAECAAAVLRAGAAGTHIHLDGALFPPGSVAVFDLDLASPPLPLSPPSSPSSPSSSSSSRSLSVSACAGWAERAVLEPFVDGKALALAAGADAGVDAGAWEPMRRVLAGLDLVDFNVLLFRCDDEEREFTNGQVGAYHVPGYGCLCYCGLFGVEGVLRDVRRKRDMSHALLENIRGGNWLVDYLCDRLSFYPKLLPVQSALRACFHAVLRLPSPQHPRLVDRVVRCVWVLCEAAVASLMSPFVRAQGLGSFAHALALTSVQLYGFSAAKSDGPLAAKGGGEGAGGGEEGGGEPPLLLVQHSLSMAAGLPHFSSGYMRSWGRDTFIALPGLLLVTGRLRDAEALVLEFARVVHHGMVPNLHDHGHNPRYNARDATWFWMHAIVQHCKRAGSHALLQRTVERVRGRGTATVADLVQEVMQTHAKGLKFREERAGKAIDAHMRDDGFNVEVWMDDATGVVGGGSVHNCGTWMDKMGESEKAGNDGEPATPRDGAAVEIVALVAEAARFLAGAHAAGDFAYEGVRTRGGAELSYAQWFARLKANFHRLFWVPQHAHDDHRFVVDAAVVNQRGIYKDTLWSGRGWPDYQFRPNQFVAMVACPDLFDPECAGRVVARASKEMMGPLGIKTLHGADMAYRPFYDPGNDSHDHATAKGFNYHQGPEWLWVAGCFLRAKLLFPPQGATVHDMVREVRQVLRAHYRALSTSVWGGLPELTNGNGEFCAGSCPTQAWSSSTLLELLEDIAQIEQ